MDDQQQTLPSSEAESTAEVIPLESHLPPREAFHKVFEERLRLNRSGFTGDCAARQ